MVRIFDYLLVFLTVTNIKGMTTGMAVAMVVVVPVGPVITPPAVVIAVTTVVAVPPAIAPLVIVTVTPWQGPLWRDLDRHVTGGLLGHVIE